MNQGTQSSYTCPNQFRAQDGSDSVGCASGTKGRLILTMCTLALEESGAYARMLVPFPDSYEDAIRLATPLFSRSMGSIDDSQFLVLKCATKVANGTVAWCTFNPADWKDVIRPNEDEVGVFLQNFSDLPYYPVAQSGPAVPQGDRHGRTTPSSQVITETSEYPEKKIGFTPSPRLKQISITAPFGYVWTRTRTIHAPESLMALKEAARLIFPFLASYPDNTVSFSSNERTSDGSNVQLYLVEETYPTWLRSKGDLIKVDMKLPFT